MNGEIICVGTELLLGNITNTNAQYLGQGLAELGINMYNQSVVGDNSARLKAAIKEAMGRSEVIILTGGLGPTADDITKETVAAVLGVELELKQDVLKELEEYYARQGRIMPKGVEKQAAMPLGAQIFHNDVGTAPGFVIEKGGCKIITIPGPPREMKTMFDRYVKPYLKGVSGRSILSNDMHIYGMGESEVENLLGELLEGSNPTAAPYAKTGEVMIRVTASAENDQKATLMREKLTREIADRLGSVLYLVGEGDLSFAAVEELKAKGLKVATAESCTAGMLSKSLTDIGGSSAVFEMGISAYANDIKRKMLGVPQEVLDRYGAVSAETAAIMAKGIKNISGADIGIGITGVAGPEPSEGKPVGLVYVGMTDGESVWIRELNAAFGNDREKVRAYATLAALDLIRRYAVAYPRALGGGAVAGENVKVSHNATDFTLPEGTSVLGLIPFSQVLALEQEIEDAEAKTVEPELDFIEKLNKEATDTLESLEMIGFVHDPDAHIGYEDIAVDSEGFITYDDYDEPESETAKQKPSVIKRVLKYLLPWKGDSKGEVIRKLIFLIALIVFTCAGTYLLNYMSQVFVNKSLVEDAREVIKIADEGTDENGMLLKFGELYKQNPDIVGWINIEGTKIDYPVYKTDNNDYYVTHDMSRNESRYGAIFADYKAQITPERNSKNLVLYGHNMIDDSMFGSLLEYNDIDYYRQNPVIDFNTIYGEGEYKIFAVIITNAYKKQDNGFVFNYQQSAFSSDKNFLYWIENIKARSIINTDVDVVATDEILTLSTCSYEFEEARTVVLARKIRNGESRRVNTNIAEKNKEPLFPQAYYDKYGGKKPKIKIELESDEEEVIETKIEAYNAKGDKVEINEEDLNPDQDKESDKIKFVEIDNFVGLSLTSAIYKLNEAGLYINSIEYKEADEKNNTVLKQNLKVGSEVAALSGIDLTVSGEAEEITIPDFIGKTVDEALEIADESGVTISQISCAATEKKGKIVMQSEKPESESTVRNIVVYISSGMNRVPSVTGEDEQTAEDTLKSAGFKVKTKSVETDDEAQVGKVIDQSLEGGEFEELEETVTISIGKQSKKKDTASKKESSSKESSSKSESSEVTSSKATTSKNSSKASSSEEEKEDTTSSKESDSSANASSEAKDSASKTASDEAQEEANEGEETE